MHQNQPKNHEHPLVLWEILPLKTITVPPYTTTNTVFYGDKAFIVIDPAPKDSQGQKILQERIEERIFLGQKLLAFYLTHHHDDHCGAAAALSAYFKVPIGAHEKASTHLGYATERTFIADSFIEVDGRHIEALYTPGHAESHMVYYDEQEGTLIAGDMITDRGCVLIPPGSGSLSVYLASMERLSKLKLATIIPAHGRPITKNAKAFLIDAIEHRLSRIMTILQVLEQQEKGMDASDITMKVYQQVIDETLLPFAQLSVESSLNWLLEKGLAQKTEQYKWLSTRDELKKELFLVKALRKLNERLRDP